MIIEVKFGASFPEFVHKPQHIQNLEVEVPDDFYTWDEDNQIEYLTTDWKTWIDQQCEPLIELVEEGEDE